MVRQVPELALVGNVLTDGANYFSRLLKTVRDGSSALTSRVVLNIGAMRTRQSHLGFATINLTIYGYFLWFLYCLGVFSLKGKN